MANTVSSLSYANTFGDWMVATNGLVVENNILAKDNYVKDSGTLYLSESSQTALQSNGNVIIQKVFSVQGIGSSASIQNNLDVQGQGYFTNVNLSLATTGGANVGKTLTVLGTGNGLVVSNNAIISGNVAISYATITRTLQANNTVNTSYASVYNTTFTNKLQANTSTLTDVSVANSSSYTTYLQANTNVLTGSLQANDFVNTRTMSVTGITHTNVLQANTSTNTSNASIVWTLYANNVQANATVNTTTASITGTTFTKNLQANTQANTQTLSVTQTAFVNILQANSAVNTTTLSVTNTSHTNVLQANTLANTETMTVTGVTHTDVLQANSAANTRTMSVTGTTHTDVLQANSAANTRTMSVTGTTHTDVLQANSAANTRTMSVTGVTHTDVLQANSAANTETMSVTGVTHTDVLQANSAANTRTMSVTGTTHTDLLVANTRINTINVWSTHTVTANTIRANSDVFTPNVRVSELIDAEDAEARVFNLQVGEGGLSIAGNFTLNGRTVFNSNEFIISQATPNQTAKFAVFRTANGVANGVASNATIRWNETDNYFDINDVSDGTYYRIITEQQLTGSTTTVSSVLAASATAANTLNNAIQTANTFLKARINSADSFANGAFVRANSAYLAQNITAVFANAGFAHANASFAAANNVGPQIEPAHAKANAAFSKANAATSEIKGTTGSISPTEASLTFTSNNGVQIYATSANTLAISTSQDLRTTATPSFSSLTLPGTPLPASSGGTGSTSASSAFNTLVAAATGTASGTSGYVLATGGTGNFYWTSAGAGGAGTQPGTRITSNRLSYTGDGTTTIYATPTFSQANQVRVYINGVRQLESEYSLNSGTSRVTMSVAPVLNDKMLVEVDGYEVYEYFANNIVYGPATGALSTGTIQSAIDGLESGKMPKTGGTFTGQVIGQTVAASVANTSLATGTYVHNLANSSYTFTHSITGNAGTVTNGVYTTSSLANPTFITSLSAAKLTLGTIPSATLGNSNLFVGTTSIALNRASAVQTLSGVSIDGNAGTVGTLSVNTNTRNNEANKIVRTDGNGYIEATYFNSSSGNENNASNPPRVWGTNGTDNYMRSYQTGSLSVGSATNASYAGNAGYATNAGNVTSTRGILGYSLAATDISTADHLGPQIMGQENGAAAMSFHRPNRFAVNFGLGVDNQLRIGGWSIGGGVSYVILDSGNYTSYAPTKTGDGASGTWSINVTGSAGSASNAGYAGYAGSAGYASTAGNATYAGSAGSAGYATSAGSATNAGSATYAGSAGSATNASYAGNAGYAGYAGSAGYASSAGNATYAASAGSVGVPTSLGIGSIKTVYCDSGPMHYYVGNTNDTNSYIDWLGGTVDIEGSTLWYLNNFSSSPWVYEAYNYGTRIISYNESGLFSYVRLGGNVFSNFQSRALRTIPDIFTYLGHGGIVSRLTGTWRSLGPLRKHGYSQGADELGQPYGYIYMTSQASFIRVA